MLFIRNGTIYTMAEKVIKHGDILVEGGKIINIGTGLQIPQNKIKTTQIINADGNWVMPGIIEAHCHLGITEEKKGKEGDDCNEAVNPVTPQLKAIDAVNPMDAGFDDAVKAGITSAMIGPGSSNVVGGQFLFMKTKGRCIDRLAVLEPAAMKIALGENPKRNYGERMESPATRMSIAAILREELTMAVIYKKEKEKATENNEDFQIDYKKECWMPVLNREIPLKAHVHRADDIYTAIRIAKEFNLKMTLDHCSEGHLIADDIKESGYPAIVGPDLSTRNKIEVQNMAFKTAGILNKKGILVAITTDHPVSLIQSLPICAGLAVKAGLLMEEGLKAITINPAIICNVENRVGSLEIGKDADISIFSGNPMEIFTETLYTIIDGEIAYRNEKYCI